MLASKLPGFSQAAAAIDARLAGKPDSYLTSLLLGVALAVIVLAFVAPPALKPFILAYLVLP